MAHRFARIGRANATWHEREHYTPLRPFEPFAVETLLAMSGIHDIGGLHGFGQLEIERDEPPFHHEWEARVFAINRHLLGARHYTLDEFRAAVERIPPAEYLPASYYERWLRAIESLVAEKGWSPSHEPRPRGLRRRGEPRQEVDRGPRGRQRPHRA